MILNQVHPTLTISDAAVEAVHTRLMKTFEAVGEDTERHRGAR